MSEEISNLQEMLDRIDRTADEEQTLSLGTIVESVGGRSFGPLLLVAGLVMTSPLSGIPGMPTSMGLLVLLIAGQLLFGKEHFWLPRWLLRRSVERSRVRTMLRFLRPPARFVDRWLRPRLTLLVGSSGIRSIAAICIVIAVTMPVMELVPFSAHGAGLALSAFALSLIVRDGLVALLAFLVTAATYGLVAYNSL